MPAMLMSQIFGLTGISMICEMLYVLTAWLFARVGYKLSFGIAIAAAAVTAFLAGWVVFFLAFKALFSAAASHFVIPPIAAAALHFMPTPAACSLFTTIIVGAYVIRANFKVFLYFIQLARDEAFAILTGT